MQFEDDVDPEVRQFCRIVNADYARFGVPRPTVVQRRATAELVRKPWAQGGPQMVESIDLRVGAMNVPIRIHRPVVKRPLPTLVYMHGGGWVLFSLDSHDRLMREYAARAGFAVVGIDYSRAPEAKFPKALDEITSVMEWIQSSGATEGLDVERICVGGDSAGGNLALSTCLKTRDERRPLPVAMLLNYGALDTNLLESGKRYDGDNYNLTAPEMDEFWSSYLGDMKIQPPVLATPLHADLTGLPPVFLCIAECDVLTDQNKLLANRLRSAGVDVTEKLYKGATHSFLEAMSISRLASQALDDQASWLREKAK